MKKYLAKLGTYVKPISLLIFGAMIVLSVDLFMFKFGSINITLAVLLTSLGSCVGTAMIFSGGRHFWDKNTIESPETIIQNLKDALATAKENEEKVIKQNEYLARYAPQLIHIDPAAEIVFATEKLKFYDFFEEVVEVTDGKDGWLMFDTNPIEKTYQGVLWVEYDRKIYIDIADVVVAIQKNKLVVDSNLPIRCALINNANAAQEKFCLTQVKETKWDYDENATNNHHRGKKIGTKIEVLDGDGHPSTTKHRHALAQGLQVLNDNDMQRYIPCAQNWIKALFTNTQYEIIFEPLSQTIGKPLPEFIHEYNLQVAKERKSLLAELDLI